MCRKCGKNCVHKKNNDEMYIHIRCLSWWHLAIPSQYMHITNY